MRLDKIKYSWDWTNHTSFDRTKSDIPGTRHNQNPWDRTKTPLGLDKIKYSWDWTNQTSFDRPKTNIPGIGQNQTFFGLEKIKYIQDMPK